MSYYRDVYLKSAEWAALKSTKENKTAKRCAICLEYGPVDLHHLFYRENLNDAETSDLRWLCRRCHAVAHDLINRRILVFKPDWSHHAMFACTKTRVKQAIGLQKISVKNKSPVTAQIEAIKTEKGGFTRASLSKIGVPWPPPKGWKRDLESKQRLNFRSLKYDK